MTRTQPPNLQYGFPADNRKPALSGNPCRQGHETFRPNLRDTGYVNFSVRYDKCDLFRGLWQLYIIFSTFFSILCVFNLKSSHAATQRVPVPVQLSVSVVGKKVKSAKDRR